MNPYRANPLNLNSSIHLGIDVSPRPVRGPVRVSAATFVAALSARLLGDTAVPQKLRDIAGRVEGLSHSMALHNHLTRTFHGPTGKYEVKQGAVAAAPETGYPHSIVCDVLWYAADKDGKTTGKGRVIGSVTFLGDAKATSPSPWSLTEAPAPGATPHDMAALHTTREAVEHALSWAGCVDVKSVESATKAAFAFLGGYSVGINRRFIPLNAAPAALAWIEGVRDGLRGTGWRGHYALPIAKTPDSISLLADSGVDVLVAELRERLTAFSASPEGKGADARRAGLLGGLKDLHNFIREMDSLRREAKALFQGGADEALTALEDTLAALDGVGTELTIEVGKALNTAPAPAPAPAPEKTTPVAAPVSFDFDMSL